jgi:hypothetical protein
VGAPVGRRARGRRGACALGGDEAPDAPSCGRACAITRILLRSGTRGDALWRLSVRSTTPFRDLGGEQLIEWGGALRWLVADRGATPSAARLRRAHGGHATCFRGAARGRVPAARRRRCCAAPAAEARVRPARHPQSRAHVPEL